MDVDFQFGLLRGKVVGVVVVGVVVIVDVVVGVVVVGVVVGVVVVGVVASSFSEWILDTNTKLLL